MDINNMLMDETIPNIVPIPTATTTDEAGCSNNNNNTSNNDEFDDVFDRIKTHFPPAKIKKIMQTDEDIGKVSQATPVIAGRSLEFFMAMLVQKSSNLAREMGTKRISADILKQTIMTDEKFDFLRESICDDNNDEDTGDAEI